MVICNTSIIITASKTSIPEISITPLIFHSSIVLERYHYFRRPVHISARALGYRVARIKGSHVRMRCPGRKPVTVSRHHELDRDTLKAILRTANLTVEEFIKLLRG